MAKPTLNIVVHVNDETSMGASRVPSGLEDFVSVKVGPDVSILLFNHAQAKVLADAAVEAFRILMQIEVDEKAAELTKSMVDNTVDYMRVDTSGWDNCSVENPCQDCQDHPEYFEEDEMSYNTADTSDWGNCTVENPCQECRDSDYVDTYENDEPLYYDFEDDNDRF